MAGHILRRSGVRLFIVLLVIIEQLQAAELSKSEIDTLIKNAKITKVILNKIISLEKKLRQNHVFLKEKLKLTDEKIEAHFGDPCVGNVTDQACPSGGRGFRGRCYYFLEPRDYSDNIQECKDRGGFLVSILDGEEQDFLATVLEELFHSTGRTSWHIGLYSETNQYDRWIDGNVVNYTNWGVDGRTGRPEPGYAVEKCVVIVKEPDWKWHDVSCGRRAAICKV